MGHLWLWPLHGHLIHWISEAGITEHNFAHSRIYTYLFIFLEASCAQQPKRLLGLCTSWKNKEAILGFEMNGTSALVLRQADRGLHFLSNWQGDSVIHKNGSQLFSLLVSFNICFPSRISSLSEYFNMLSSFTSNMMLSKNKPVACKHSICIA